MKGRSSDTASPRLASASRGVRVCHIISTFHPVVGGAQRVTEDLCGQLLERGVDLIVLTRYARGLPRVEKVRGVTVCRAGLGTTGRLGGLIFFVHAVWLLLGRFKAYSILHAHNLDSPLVVGMLCRALARRRLIVTIHGDVIAPKKESAAGRLRLRLMRKLVDHFVALSTHMRASIRAEVVSPNGITLVPNGVDTRRIFPATAADVRSARCHLGLPRGIVVLFVGRLVALKRVDALLYAWNSVPAKTVDDELVIVGDGPERAALNRLADELKASNVRFVGATQDVADYLKAADVFVLPSIREGVSIALLEAMAAGLAVIVSAIPGNQSVVEAGVNGIVVPVDEPEAIARALESLVRSPEARADYGARARATVERRFSLQRMAEAHLQLYRWMFGELQVAGGSSGSERAQGSFPYDHERVERSGPIDASRAPH